MIICDPTAEDAFFCNIIALGEPADVCTYMLKPHSFLEYKSLLHRPLNLLLLRQVAQIISFWSRRQPSPVVALLGYP
jgi:hypothetical protein